MMLIKSAILFDFRRRTCCSGVSVSSGVGIILENIWQGILRSYQEIGFSIFLGYLESVGKIRKCLFDSISNAMGKKLLTYSLGIPLLFGISLTLPRVGVWIFYGTTQFQFRHKAKNSMRIYRDGKTVLFFNPGKTQISTRKFSEVKKHIRYACSRSFFRQGWKNDSDYMDFSARLARLEILARFENTGLGFLARAGMHPGLNPSPCNSRFRSWAEISARLAWLKFQSGIKFAM